MTGEMSMDGNLISILIVIVLYSKRNHNAKCTQKKCLIADSFYFVTETLAIIIIPRGQISRIEFKGIFYVFES